MLVTWDPQKARANLAKHGIRLSDADVVLSDPDGLTREDSTSVAERRFVSIGSDAVARVLVVVFTYRGEDVRLISARLATPMSRGDNMKKEYDFSKGKRGAVIPQPGKTRITIYLDESVLEAFRDRADAAGRGYQTMSNVALRTGLPESVDASTIRVSSRRAPQDLDDRIPVRARVAQTLHDVAHARAGRSMVGRRCTRTPSSFGFSQ